MVLCEGRRPTLRRLGRRLGARLLPGDVVCLQGELGAGKTFLAQALALGAGVPRSVRVTSPTFALVQEYSGRLAFHHADLYRLGGPEELRELGLFERAEDGVLVLEWPERCGPWVPEGALWLTLEIVEPFTRRVTARGTGQRVERLLTPSPDGAR
ncbi:MAG: tRNA (adenosine(37)-N6)-threonylcarbamoyltransferase complex ATPase subunit type 1 TsaE [Deltaproteobacteria bacterium]|nr:tRNA (adenosine(37)-N6)-threonylcarbamoyltransferase complex ATPase subunit type 1 TsaE [Deltaproteobacteria bacterium]